MGLKCRKRVPYQGGKQVATDKEGEGAHEDCVVDAPNRGDCMGDDTSHDHHHQRQRSEHYVHRPVVPESGSQLHMQAMLSAPTDSKKQGREAVHSCVRFWCIGELMCSVLIVFGVHCTCASCIQQVCMGV